MAGSSSRAWEAVETRRFTKEVRPQPDLPKIDIYNGIEERAMANQPHHVNASIRHVDLGAEAGAEQYL